MQRIPVYGLVDQSHVPVALPPEKTRFPLYGRLGEPQGRSGRVFVHNNLSDMAKRFSTVAEFLWCIEVFHASTWEFLLQCVYVHSCQQKSMGLKFSKSQTGSDVRYSYHHNSSRFTFPIFAHSCRFSVLHSLQSITPRIY